MKKEFPVTNMSCANCALGVEKALNNQPGVTKANVNFANNIVSLDYEPSKTSPEKLKQVVQSIGYDMIIDDDEQERLQKQEDQSRRHFKELKRNTILSWVFSIPIMVISMSYMGHSNNMLNYLLLILALPVLTVFGRNFFINGWKHAIKGKANMDTLVALSTSIAFLFSLFNTIYPQFWTSRDMSATVYYEAATMIISFVLLGKLLEERAKGNTSSAIKKLMGLQPKVATLLKGNASGVELSAMLHIQIPISQIKAGDLIVVKPGEKIPVDGVVISGYSYVDESAITGESVAVEKHDKDNVLAGTINQKGSLVFKAEKVGGNTLLAQIIKMVRDAQGSKAPVQRIVDKIASIFVPIVITISILTLILWLTIGGAEQFSRALLSAVSVLVIACPCAMGLATPTALMVGIGKGAQQHILIKDATALEQMKRVNAVVLDKTGTLTEGMPVVTDWVWFSSGNRQGSKSETRQELEKIILELEKRSEHPLASAIVGYLKVNSNLSDSSDTMLNSFEAIPGKGVDINYKGNNYWAGNLELAGERIGKGLSGKTEEFERIETLKQEGKSIVIYGVGKEMLAVIAIADKIKETSFNAVKELKNNGIEVHMLTGDNISVASAVAKQLGITHFKAGTLPGDKEEYIKELQAAGKTVAMVGDGINDSQALARADVSIAMGKGTDIAMDVAMMTLITSDLQLLPKAFALSKKTVRLIHQNLFWAFIYNLIGIPIAAGLLYPFTGLLLNPMIAAAAMAFSSVSVVLNSLRLGR